MHDMTSHLRGIFASSLKYRFDTPRPRMKSNASSPLCLDWPLALRRWQADRHGVQHRPYSRQRGVLIETRRALRGPGAKSQLQVSSKEGFCVEESSRSEAPYCRQMLRASAFASPILRLVRACVELFSLSFSLLA